MKTYSELITIPSFRDRYLYLKIGGKIGEDTFGFNRYLNQVFYKSPEWKRFRRDIIVRDFGRDLGIADREIFGQIVVHHINPITLKDIAERSKALLDPENAITISPLTHRAVHYGDESLLLLDLTERKLNDTCPWK